MPPLKLPPGADSGFRLECQDAFEMGFSASVYGRGRGGWIVPVRRIDGFWISLAGRDRERYHLVCRSPLDDAEFFTGLNLVYRFLARASGLFPWPLGGAP